MAYQAPAFYYYHAARTALSTPTSQPVESSQSIFDFADSKHGEKFVFSTDIDATTDKRYTVEHDGSALALAIKHVIVANHNINGAEFAIRSLPSGTNHRSYPVTEANGELISISLNSTPDDTKIEFFLVDGVSGGSIVPEFGEIVFTTEHEMTRGPEPDFNSSYQRNQSRFVNDAGVSSTELRGPARKTYTLTWDHVVGADRQILLDLRTQTADWSFPFYFRPPDDAFPTILVELNTDEQRIQDFDSPLDSGTSDRVTLNMIQALG